MRKLYSFVSILLSSSFLISCDNTPSDIRAFLDTLDYDRAYLNTNKALLELRYELYDLDDNLTGYNYTTYYFSKVDANDLVVYEIGQYSGSYIDENGCSSYSLSMSQIDGAYKKVEVTDETSVTTSIDKDYILEEIEDFFYRSDASGYKSYGYYYGDQIETIIRTQYAYFTLSEDASSLRYGVGEFELEDTINNLTYSVNKFGMLYYWEQEIYGTDSYFHGVINISYNEEASYEKT